MHHFFTKNMCLCYSVVTGSKPGLWKLDIDISHYQTMKNTQQHNTGPPCVDVSVLAQSSQVKASTESTSSSKRMSISLSDDVSHLLDFIANSQGISKNEALRKAIATESYLLQERQQGSKILLQRKDKEIREVLFR